MAIIRVTDRNGEIRDLDAPEGWRVMEVLRDYGLGIEGVCDGQCDCATCYVEVVPEWQDRLPPPREDELDKLDELPSLGDGARLSCQLLVDEDTDGLHVVLPRAA